MALSASEQYLLELTNRARLDPLAEAARYSTTLNAGLAAGSITSAPKQALAGNDALDVAADAHSAWMIRADVFSHTGSGGSSAGQRIQQAGYTLTGTWLVGENLAFVGSTGSVDLNAAIEEHHKGLFLSAGHRANTLNGGFREVGIGQVGGAFTQQGNTFQSSMTTLNFATSGNAVFITGVAYTDRNADGFYSIGEGRQGVAFQVSGAGFAANREVTTAAGGYDVHAPKAAGLATVTITHGAHTTVLEVSRAGDNVKVDLVGDTKILVSGDARLVSGPVVDMQVLGAVEADLTGSALGNRLTGNKANNLLDGREGNDTLKGMDGVDGLKGGLGNDQLYGGNGDDMLEGQDGGDQLFGDAGNDRLYGGTGNDVFAGGDGNDQLFGGSGNDGLRGGAGNDRLNGDAGNDTYTGETGADVFILRVGGGDDRIADFLRAQGDKVVLEAGLFDAGTTLSQIVSEHTERTSAGLLLTTDDGDSFLLTGVTSLSVSDIAWF